MRFRIERLGTSMSMSVALSPYITNERADSPPRLGHIIRLMRFERAAWNTTK